MLKFIIIFFILLTNILFSKVLEVDKSSEFVDVLPYSYIYIDKTKSLSAYDIKESDFKDNNKTSLAYGYSPDFHVFIKFTIQNKSSQTIEKVLEYDNTLTTNIQFYDNTNIQKEGLYNIHKNRYSLSPIFKIKLHPNEVKTYYIKAYSSVTPLIIKLKLWENDSFERHNVNHQIILALFFGAMIVLIIYNLFIYFFTKDVSYLFYVLYIFGVVIHQLVYTGIAYIYILDYELALFTFDIAAVIVAFPVFALGLFTRSFLEVKSYKKSSYLLDVLLVSLVLSIVVILYYDLNTYRGILPLLLSFYLAYITIFSAINKNKQAYFILFGWVIILFAIVMLNLSSMGVFDIYSYFPYIIEVAFLSEAIVFSIALAYKIKHLQLEKINANALLVHQEKSEKQRLAKQVEEKTIFLNTALDRNVILLKELNHRVKNNMQTILSLIRLQKNEIDDINIKGVLDTIKNRISAMNHLHEYLYIDNSDKDIDIDAQVYFSNIVNELKNTYTSSINIEYSISTKLTSDDSVHCGLIVNELVTNAFKYAFVDSVGNIFISLSKKNDMFILSVKDDGIGFDKNTKENSLGLNIVDTLATLQLKGSLTIDSSNGVVVLIKWKGCEN